MTDLKNKVAIVTGASSGIGAATVKALLETGMKVVGVARRKEKIEELGKGYEGRLFALKTDISVEKDILDAISWVQKNVGPIDVLINNAGIANKQQLGQAEYGVWKKILDTNILGLAFFTQEVVKNMKANNIGGSIVNINSAAGHYIINFPGAAMYQASKFGVTAFTESIRLELAKGGSKIRITSLSPGVTESELTQNFISAIPYVKSEDIANGIVFVLKQPPGVNVAELTIRPTGEAF